MKLVQVLASLALALSPLVGCAEDEPLPAPPPRISALEPVPAPASLMASIFIARPEATWAKARGLAGGSALFLPQTFGGLVVTLVGLPMTSANEIDGGVPVLGAVVDGEGEGRPRAVLGLHVKTGDRLVDQATKFEAPRFTSRVDPATHITLLEPKGGPGPVALGVLGNILLIGREAADVLAAGPYVARTMPTLPVIAGDLAVDLPASSLAGPLPARAAATWKGLSGPTVSSVQPVLDLDGTMNEMIALMPDLARAVITVNLEPEALRVRAELDARAGEGTATRAARAMSVGGAEKLLELPRDTLVALLWRDAEAARATGAERRAASLASLAGDGLGVKDREALSGALGRTATARGDWVIGGLSFGPTGPAGYARGAVVDEEKLTGALADLFAVTRAKGIKARLDVAKLAAKADKVVVEDLAGEVQRLRIARTDVPKPGKTPGGREDAPPASTVPAAIEVLTRVGKDEFFAAAGYDARGALRAVAQAPGTGKLGESEAVKAAVAALGPSVAFALLVEPLELVASRAGKPGAGSSAPVVLAWGKDEGGTTPRLWARVDVATPVVRELIARRAQFFP